MRNLEILIPNGEDVKRVVEEVYTTIADGGVDVKISTYLKRIAERGGNDDTRIFVCFNEEKASITLSPPKGVPKVKFFYIKQKHSPVSIRYLISAIAFDEKIISDDSDLGLLEEVDAHSVFMHALNMLRTDSKEEEWVRADTADLLHTIDQSCFLGPNKEFSFSDKIFIGFPMSAHRYMAITKIIEDKTLAPISAVIETVGFIEKEKFTEIFGFHAEDIKKLGLDDKDGKSEVVFINWKSCNMRSVAEASDLSIASFLSLSEKACSNNEDLGDWRIFRSSPDFNAAIGSRLSYNPETKTAHFYLKRIGLEKISKVVVKFGNKISINEEDID